MKKKLVLEITHQIATADVLFFDFDGKELVIHFCCRQHCAVHDVQDIGFYQAAGKSLLWLEPHAVWRSGLSGDTQPRHVLYEEYVRMHLMRLPLWFRYHVFQYHPTGLQSVWSVVGACDEVFKP